MNQRLKISSISFIKTIRFNKPKLERKRKTANTLVKPKKSFYAPYKSRENHQPVPEAARLCHAPWATRATLLTWHRRAVRHETNMPILCPSCLHWCAVARPMLFGTPFLVLAFPANSAPKQSGPCSNLGSSSFIPTKYLTLLISLIKSYL